MGGRVPDLGRRMWSCPRGHKQQSAPLLFQISLSELNGDPEVWGGGKADKGMGAMSTTSTAHLHAMHSTWGGVHSHRQIWGESPLTSTTSKFHWR